MIWQWRCVRAAVYVVLLLSVVTPRFGDGRFAWDAVPAFAQDTWTAELRRILEQAAVPAFAPEGYRMNRSLHTGSLKNRAYLTVRLPLGRGEYRIAGACDRSCTDLDMWLFGSRSNAEIDSDTGDDDFPVVSLKVARPDSFRLRIKMAACQAERCHYGFGVFRKVP